MVNVCRTCNNESKTWVQEKQIEEKFEKIYKEESETKSRRDRMRKSGSIRGRRV